MDKETLKKYTSYLIATISTIILVGMIVFMLCGLFFGFSVEISLG